MDGRAEREGSQAGGRSHHRHVASINIKQCFVSMLTCDNCLETLPVILTKVSILRQAYPGASQECGIRPINVVVVPSH